MDLTKFKAEASRMPSLIDEIIQQASSSLFEERDQKISVVIADKLYEFGVISTPGNPSAVLFNPEIFKRISKIQMGNFVDIWLDYGTPDQVLLIRYSESFKIESDGNSFTITLG